jgi:holo-[acyl-carrier protein] synthase
LEAALAIVGVGIDLVELDRIERALERWGDRFLAKIMGPAEASALPGGPDRVRAVALVVAAKEAASKALGTGWSRGVWWPQVVVDLAGPSVRFEGHARSVARTKGGTETRTALEIRGRLAIGHVRLVS